MKNDRCAVQVGIHPGPYWRNAGTAFVVCDRHRSQYDERADEFGPFVWLLDDEAPPLPAPDPEESQ